MAKYERSIGLVGSGSISKAYLKYDPNFPYWM